MIDDGFVTAVGADGTKRRVPKHYIDNPRMGYRLPPSARGKAAPAKADEPAKPEKKKEA